MTQRINWIDWAKVFAIYLVILGHHISKDAEGESFVKNFIYAFHMPFFFFISGYLFKESKSILHLLKKGIKGLIIPYITLNILVNILLLPSFIVSKHIPLDNIFYFLTGQAVGDAGPTWFLVCLFEVWIISFLILKLNIKYQFFCVLISIIIAYTFPYHLWWGIDVCFAAIPFFLLGFYMKGRLIVNISTCKKTSLFILFGGLTYCISTLTGYVEIYPREFGKYPYLYYILALCGIAHLYFLCLLFDRFPSQVLVRFSTGTIIILGLHQISIFYLHCILKYTFPFLLGSSLLWKILFCLATMFCLYIPIVVLQKTVPFLIGGRTPKTSN